MSYKVIHYFEDLQDHNYPYNIGDPFPRDGMKVSETRLSELASGENKLGRPLIQYKEDVAPAEKKPKKAATGKRKAAEK